MYSGKIKMWDTDRGFGFIRRDDGGPDAFVHIKHLSAVFRPEAGQIVTFDLVIDERNGRERADAVRLTDPVEQPPGGVI
ncbi:MULTISPECIES: cold shock domain-containing protein [Bradyrhizobium]|uniref:cold shock domain-containing protein n=1 Tax=Bradyrhizobium elkanii TaxID=29448 RepID=UPI002714A530|nr:cold shock domain-containing protein [Bradyrhizobium elkanii]WLA47294.1 cold shock domain-containing protein [Bradyrhizobium elkanii]WLB82410.1 cold shock domain-containing protein [Bradyrhizobium elkanii]